MDPIQVGQKAPEFSATAADGRPVSLSEFRGKQAVVVFFYPRDYTAICTQEACAFRDAYQDFSDAGAVVIGISSDSDARHQEFAATHRLPYYLLSDKSGELRQLFGVPNMMFLVPRRVTFVIDRDGIVRHVFNALFEGKKHIDEALQTVRGLKQTN